MLTFIRVVLARARAFLRPGDQDRDFDSELEAHLSMAEEDKIRGGMTPVEARRAARVELGGLMQLREASRAARGLPWLDTAPVKGSLLGCFIDGLKAALPVPSVAPTNPRPPGLRTLGAMTVLLLLGAAAVFLAYANGANDNFKAVATLYGSRTMSYRQALVWATLSQIAGSLAALWLAARLARQFSGKGLVPEELVGQPAFLVAVALGAALSVMTATRLGLPISTTHALTGSLVGAGLVLSTAGVKLGVLGTKFFLPLALSPFLSLLLAFLLYLAASRVRQRLGVEAETCVCVGPAPRAVALGPSGQMFDAGSGTVLSVGELESCRELYKGRVFGFSARTLVDVGHVASGASLGFARGLNDTPKVLAVLLAAQASGLALGAGSQALLALVGISMALGGLLHSRRLALTLGDRITTMNRGQGLVANLVASFLVIWASRLGLPVSTTHVSCGSIFGIGLARRQGDGKIVTQILLAWVGTLPLACALAAGVALVAKVV